MTRARVAAAIAALLTALLLQATLVGPVTMPLPVSLPALLVAAIALVDGPGAGLAFGFATGLLADLGSEHPAGVLALCWLGVGLLCGLCSSAHARLVRDVAVAGVICGAASVVAIALLAFTDAGATTAETALRSGILATLVDVALALAVVPLVRLFLHSDSLRAPRPVLLITGDENW
jgi:cell shape-determining protein MreD